MQKSTEPNKRISGNSSSENTNKISTETSANSSKIATSSEGSSFSNIFKKLVCSSSNLADDESEVMRVQKSRPK